MIDVVVKKQQERILSITVKGHAQSDEYGRDLVCAGVSTACTGVANQLVKIGFLENFGSLELKEGYFKICVTQLNEEAQVILETLETILETVEDNYNQYIKISKMEV